MGSHSVTNRRRVPRTMAKTTSIPVVTGGVSATATTERENMVRPTRDPYYRLPKTTQ
jgi:hypothetical protein